MENDKKMIVEQYLTKNHIENGSLSTIIWLGFMGNLTSEQIDLYILQEGFSLKQRDIIRVALEEGIRTDRIKDALCDPLLSVENMVNMKKELLQSVSENGYQTNVAIESLKLLAAQIENQMNENRMMGEFLRETVEKENRREIEMLKKQLEDLKKEKQLPNKEDTPKRVITPLVQAEKPKILKLPGKEPCKEKDKPEVPKQTFKDLFSNLKKKKPQKEKSILDILCNVDFTAEQMREISAGYDAGLSMEDISKYAKKEISAEKMRELRKLILTIKNQANCVEKQQKQEQKEIKPIDIPVESNTNEDVYNEEEPLDFYADEFLRDDME